MQSPPNRYSLVAILLHWTIAALIVWTLTIIWTTGDLRGMARAEALQPHKTIGITILLLTLARLAWRLTVKPPPLPSTLKPWERWLANTVHILFYVLLIAMPLSGWAMVSASRLIEVYPIRLGPFVWPAIQVLSDLPRHEMRDAHEAFEAAHGLLAKVLVYGLLPLHIAGALKHQLIDRDHELGRMIPFLRRPS